MFPVVPGNKMALTRDCCHSVIIYYMNFLFLFPRCAYDNNYRRSDRIVEISYVAGNQYCVLLIPRKKAEQLNIADSDKVNIRTIEHGIVLETEDS